MKELLISLAILFSISHSILDLRAQKFEPELLLYPENWRFERLDFPLDFAPNIQYEGFEELRFAPGMFDTLANDYFTYVFAIEINKDEKLKKDELHSFLSMYYKGLCMEVAKSNNFLVDTTKVSVEIQTINSNSSFHGKIFFFDTFTNGKEITLYVEINAIAFNEKQQIIAFVSPQNKDSEIWKSLYKIRDKVLLE